jgi:hypothetical protein
MPGVILVIVFTLIEWNPITAASAGLAAAGGWAVLRTGTVQREISSVES